MATSNPKAEHPTTKLVQISGWVEPELADRFKAAAKTERRSISMQVGLLLERFVDDHEAQKQAA